MPSIRSAAAAVLALFLGASARADYVSPRMTHAPVGHLKVVSPITTGDYDILRMKLRNLLNGAAAAKQGNGRLEARLIFYAKAPKLLTTAELPQDVRKDLDAARAAGVKIEICNNTLREQALDFHALYGVTEADIVPSGFLEVARLQQHGFVVDPSN
jgi:intracellular sulfur oxidation DsrE/DsrF family protein